MPPFSIFPEPAVTMLEPGVLSAYGALVIAATLSVLYLYRGRAFIVYWIGGWLFVASALVLVSRTYTDNRIGSVLTGLAAALVVWAAGLVLMASRAFPSVALRWTRAVRFAAASGVWFLAGPFLIKPVVIIATALLIGLTLLGFAAWHYAGLFR